MFVGLSPEAAAESDSPRAVPEHITILDGSGRIIAFNDAWRQFVESAGVEFQIGQSYLQACEEAFGREEQEGSAVAAGLRGIMDGEQNEFSVVLPFGSDEGPYCRIHASRLEGASPAAMIVTHVVLDRTTDEAVAATRPSAGATFLQLRKHLNRSGENLVATTLANISHELRTPLHAILGFSHLLLKEPLQERISQKLQHIQEAGRGLIEQVNNLIDFAMLEAGEFRLIRGVVSARTLAEEVAEQWRACVGEKQLSIAVQLADDVPEKTDGDPGRLRQVLGNLLSNAVKFSERGNIQLIVEKGTAADGGDALKFTVRDEGVGIPADLLTAIFLPFRQVDSSLGRQYGGLGIGLAVAKRLVESWKGALVAESQTGKGSCFTFTLPVAAEKRNVEPLPDDIWQARLRQLRRAIRAADWDTVEALSWELGTEAQRIDSPAGEGHALRIRMAARQESEERANEALDRFAANVLDLTRRKRN